MPFPFPFAGEEEEEELDDRKGEGGVCKERADTFLDEVLVIIRPKFLSCTLPTSSTMSQLPACSCPCPSPCPLTPIWFTEHENLSIPTVERVDTKGFPAIELQRAVLPSLPAPTTTREHLPQGPWPLAIRFWILASTVD